LRNGARPSNGASRELVDGLWTTGGLMTRAAADDADQSRLTALLPLPTALMLEQSLLGVGSESLDRLFRLAMILLGVSVTTIACPC
jgi:hypothetical protein